MWVFLLKFRYQCNCHSTHDRRYHIIQCIYCRFDEPFQILLTSFTKNTSPKQVVVTFYRIQILEVVVSTTDLSTVNCSLVFKIPLKNSHLVVSFSKHSIQFRLIVYLLCASVSDRNYWSTVNTKWPLICGRKRYTSGLWILVQIVLALEGIALNHLLCLYAWDNTPTGCCAATRWHSPEKKSAWYKLGIQYSRSVYALDNGVK